MYFLLSFWRGKAFWRGEAMIRRGKAMIRCHFYQQQHIPHKMGGSQLNTNKSLDLLFYVSWTCYFRLKFLCHFLSWCQNLHKLAMYMYAYNAVRKFSVLCIGSNNTVVDLSTEICLKKNCFNLGRRFPWGEQLRLITKLLTGQETALEGLFVVIVSQNNIK